ncbi:MAG: DUF2510 domain-containing protein [Actinomycetota bacterium]
MSEPPIWAPGAQQPNAPANWYPDPERPGWWRWWDGRVWTNHGAPMGPSEPQGRPATKVARWFDRSWAVGVSATRPFVPILAAVWLLLAATYVGLFLWLLGRPELDTIRDELGLNDRFQPTVASNTVTDSESDAALDALGDLVIAAIPPFVIVGVVSWIAAAWTVALIVRRIETTQRAQPDVIVGEDGPAAALRRTPTVLAAWLIVVVLGVAIWVVSFAPMAVFIILEVGGDDSYVLPIVVAALFGAIAAIGVSLVVIPRIALATVAAGFGGRGLGITHVWRSTNGRWGATALRMLLMYLISAVATVPFSIVGQAVGLLGFTAFAIALALNQAVTMLASSLVYASGGAVFLLDVEAFERGRDDGDDQRGDPGLPPPVAPQPQQIIAGP